jgi:hypothetical protein
MKIGYVTKQQLRQPSIERDGVIWFQPRSHLKFWASRTRGHLLLTPLTIAYTRKPASPKWRWAFRLYKGGLPLLDYPSFDDAAADAAQLLTNADLCTRLQARWPAVSA